MDAQEGGHRAASRARDRAAGFPAQGAGQAFALDCSLGALASLGIAKAARDRNITYGDSSTTRPALSQQAMTLRTPNAASTSRAI
jgi:hypothetical protein